jgi:predicted nucleic acid-binding protein
MFVRNFALGLRAPDALHAAVCRRADLTLVTLDRRLASAAEALDVRVVVP